MLGGMLAEVGVQARASAFMFALSVVEGRVFRHPQIGSGVQARASAFTFVLSEVEGRVFRDPQIGRRAQRT